MKKNRLEEYAKYIPLILFLIAFIPRFYYMNPGLFHTDSVIMVNAVENTFKTGKLHYMHAPGYPGQVVITTMIYGLHHLMTGTESAEFACTFTSVLFGSLGVVAMFLLVRELTGSQISGVTSALTLTFFPVYLSLSTYAKDHAMEVFFLLISGYLAVRAGKTNSNGTKILASAALGYAATVRIVNLMFAPFFLLLYFGRIPITIKKEKEILKLELLEDTGKLAKDILKLSVPAIVVFLLLYAQMLTTEGIEPITGVAKYARWAGIYHERLTKLSLEWATVSITHLGWILFVVGLYVAFLGNRYNATVLLLWFLVFFLYGGNLGITSPRYVIPALLPVVMLIGIAINGVYNRLGSTAGILVLLALLLLMFSNIQPILEFRREFSGPKEFALNVKENTEPNAVILVMDQSYHIQYYAKRRPLSYTVAYGEQGMNNLLNEINSLLDNGTPVYGMAPSLFSYDRNGMLKKKIFEGFTLTKVGDFPNEDWHHKSIFSGTYDETLFRVHKD